MPTFQIEMLWDCPVCKATRNKGLQKHCRNCGHPKNDLCTDYMPEHVTIADALTGDEKAHAEAGPDWKCLYCNDGSLQSGLNKCCTECGAPQGSDKPWQAVVTETTFDPFSGVKLEEHKHVEQVDASPLSESLRPPVPVSSSKPSPSPGRKSFVPPPFPVLKVLTIGLPGLMLLGLLSWALFRTKTVDARVASLAWEHKVLIDRYQVHHHDGWIADFNGFNTHYVGMRVHHYDRVRVGSHEERYTAQEACGQDCRTVPGSCSTTPTNCKSNKNGAATCKGGDRVCSPDRQSCSTKYCSVQKSRTVDDYENQPQYLPWYEWDLWEWGYNRAVTRAGTTPEESWPTDVELTAPLREGEKEREGGRKMSHKVVFTDGKETWDYEPSVCQEFTKYPVGTQATLKVGVAHGVEVLPPHGSSW